MNGACIMLLESVLGPQSELIKSHVISLRRRREQRGRGEQLWGIAEGRSLTSSSLLRMLTLCKHKSLAHTKEEISLKQIYPFHLKSSHSFLSYRLILITVCIIIKSLF